MVGFGFVIGALVGVREGDLVMVVGASVGVREGDLGMVVGASVGVREGDLVMVVGAPVGVREGCDFSFSSSSTNVMASKSKGGNAGIAPIEAAPPEARLEKKLTLAPDISPPAEIDCAFDMKAAAKSPGPADPAGEVAVLTSSEAVLTSSEADSARAVSSQDRWVSSQLYSKESVYSTSTDADVNSAENDNDANVK